MKTVAVLDIQEGMMTAEPVYDKGGYIELLKAGTVLTLRHVRLLENLGIHQISVLEEKDPEYQIYIAEDEDGLQENRGGYDMQKLAEDLKEIETENYFETLESVANRNMEIHILTGEANEPIDLKYEEELGEVKNIFNAIKESDVIEVREIKDRLKTMLPAMINNNDVLMRLSQLSETDDYLFDHSFRVSIMAANLAKWLRYEPQDIENIALSALLYEVGNLRLPQQIFKKHGPLTTAEKLLVEKAPQLAYNILLKTPGLSRDIKIVALQHHERLDGTGYPLRVRSAQIHDFSKIIMVCDIYDAMTHDRPYRKKLSPFQAAEFILWESGRSLDMKVCYFFLKNLAEFYTGKNCLLSNGETAKIVYVDVNYPTRPLLQLGNRFIDLSKDHSLKIEELY